MQIIDFINFEAITAVLAKNPLLPSLFFAITDMEGRTLASSQWRNVCSEFHRKDKRTRHRCIQSDIVLANQIKKGEDYAFYTCYNHLTDAAVPIRVEGEHIGNLIIGQVFIHQPDIEFFREQAIKYDFDIKEYLHWIAEVPIIAETDLRKVMEFYTSLMVLFGSMAKQAYLISMNEKQVVQKNAELQYINSELEAFSYSVSHDLRAPLRHISGYIELFNRRYRGLLPEQGEHYFEAINDSAQQMGKLIDELLQFSRNGRMEMLKADLDMNKMVEELFKKANNDGRAIEWTIDPLPKAFGDESMFKLVWQNLIDNAIKFTGKTENARIHIGCGYEGEAQVYFIADNGAGFDMRYADKLFGVFQRLHTKDEFDGIGIGLASVKRIISRHGGRIWAEAEPNHGATFYFTL